MNQPDESSLQSLLRDIDIPPCPAILVELDAELRSEDADQRSIARLISRDVALSGQVMHIANSPAFSIGRPVDSIVQALNVLGTRQVFNLVVTQLLKTALAGSPDVGMDRFWDSSANIARVSSEIARRLRPPGLKPDMAYTFGLFHDCGIPLMMKRFGNYRAVLAEANASAEGAFTDIEDARLGTNHAAVGYFLARRWRLPEFVVQGIRLHHDYDILLDEALPEESRSAIAVNALAEHLVRLLARLSVENEWLKASERVAGFFGLSGDELEDFGEDLLDWLNEQEVAA